MSTERIAWLPKAGALALLQRTAARERKQGNPQQNTQEEEENAEEREKREVAVDAKLVMQQLEMTSSGNGLMVMYLKGFSCLTPILC